MNHSVGSNQDYMKVSARTKIMSPSMHLLSVSRTNQEKKHESPLADNDYEPFDSSPEHLRHQSRLCEVPLITEDDDDPFDASLGHHQYADHQHATRSPMRPPSFISCPDGTLFCVLSCNNSQKILDTSRTDLENVLLLQGQFCSRRLLQMSEVFTNNAQEQALLQGPKALKNFRTLHRIYCLLQPVLIQSNYIFSPEVFIENRYTYKQQEDYLWFDDDLDNDDDDDDEDVSNASLLPLITPTTTPTTTASNLLLTLINQVPVTPPIPPPSPLPLSPFKFSYMDVTPPQTTPGPSADSDTVTSSSLALAIKTVSCDYSGTAILPTMSLERITSYSLLSSCLLIPSYLIKLSYSDDHYCTVLISKQRPPPTPSSIPSTVTKTFTPPLQDMPSRYVEIGVMMILTMTILSTILIIILILLPMTLLMLPAVL